MAPAAGDRMAPWQVVAGVALLAAGGSALNQVVERQGDALMSRTCGRPLPSGEMTAASAAVAGCMVIVAGLILLGLHGGPAPPLLGGGTLVWYLGIYTPLKRRTALAPMIGALCGALPPVIGWSMAGGDPGDYRIVLLAGVMYLWQIPHFWLLQRRYADDYRRAGIPLLHVGSRISATVPASLSISWTVALAAAAALLLPAFGIIGGRMALWYTAMLLPLPFLSYARHERALFSYLNLYPLLVAAVLFFRCPAPP